MNEIDKPICDGFGVCGGCVYQDIPYADECIRKETSVLELIRPYADGVFEGIKPAPHVIGYRNKMEFAFGDEGKGGRLALGIRKRRSFYEVVTPLQCTLIPDDFKAVLNTVLEYFRGTGETFFHRKLHTGALRHLTLRRGEFTGELLINLVTTSTLTTPLAPLTEQLTALPLDGSVAGILHTVNDGVADTVKNENVRILAGRDYFYEKLNGLTFKVSAFSFLQTNSAGAELLYETVSEYAGLPNHPYNAHSTREGLVYDLYCGTGTIAQILSKNAKQVAGVEINVEAVEAATENTAINGINNCTFIAGDAATETQKLADTYGRPDVVIVDPPRDGLHPKALPVILALRAPVLVYVSCKPSSLARDMATLAANGYQTERAVCVDMFPRTVHVETVVRMALKQETL